MHKYRAFYIKLNALIISFLTLSTFAYSCVNIRPAPLLQKIKHQQKNKNFKRKSLQVKPTVYCWGDSFTSSDYPVTFAELTGYKMIDKGVGGETSTQIKQRMLNDTKSHKYATIIWAGRNNYLDTSTVISDIKEMVNALSAAGNSKYLVIGIVNGDYISEYKGGPKYNVIMSLNKSLAKIYGKNFIDIRPVLVGLYNRNSPSDLLDYQHDVPPGSKRIDKLHPTLAADTIIAKYFMKSINILTKN